MEDEHPLKGKFKFRDLPFERVIATRYKLQGKMEDEDEDDGYIWIDLSGFGDYEDIYNEYKRRRDKFKCRMFKVETSVWEIEEL